MTAMPRPNESDDREERAVQALISAALHADDAEVAAQEIEEHLRADPPLSPEDEAALRRAGRNPLTRVSEPESAQQTYPAQADAIMAFHRKLPDGGLSPLTEEELEKKREELLAKLRRRKGEP